MANFKFGKKKQGKNKQEDELSKGKEGIEEKDLDTSSQEHEGRFQTVNDTEEDEFFEDDFGIVDNPSVEDDLEDKAKKYAEEAQVTPKYTKEEPNWYEKGANIIMVIVILTVIVVTGLFIYREPIRNFIGSGTEEIRDLDIQGEVTDYKDDVKDALKGSDKEVEDKEDKKKVDVVESIPEGEYTVGKDMSSGVWIAENVLLEVYQTEEDYKDKKSPIATNVSAVDIQKIITLSDGLFVVVRGGNLVFNETRPEVAVNVGDTLIFDKDEQLFVGKDIPEGFYTLYNLDILEKMETNKARNATIKVVNATDDEPTSFGIERKTTIFLRKGLILTFKSDLLGERVSSDGTYGGDKEFLNNMTQEKEDAKKDK